MLIRFAVSNFMSFRESTEFVMSAGKISRHSSHIAEIGGKRILKSSFIFGANASGKSNLISAMNFAKEIVSGRLPSMDLNKRYFRLDNEYKYKPGVFQFDIFANGKFYSYGFAISYTERNILEEWLYEIGDKEKCIFSREKLTSGEVKVSTDINFKDNHQKERFSIYLEDIKNPKMDQTLFLLDIIMRSSDDDIYDPFKAVINWFEKLIIIFPNSKYTAITKFLESDNAHNSLESLLEYFDTGITSVEKSEKDIDAVFKGFPNHLVEEIKADMIRELSKGVNGASLDSEVSKVEVKIKEGSLYAEEVLMSHGNPDELFEFADESDGTKRLFDLIPLYELAKEECVIIIDEIDRSLHTKATIEFIKHFYHAANKSNAQLIATTHDSNVMDLELLRQDEIWFVERQKDHSSKLFSLNKFKTRFDKKVEKEYLLGRYGAVPVFNQFALIDEEGEFDE